jgi:hypothetical protein
MAVKRFAVSIANWSEYQERPDRANYTWCKLHQKILTGDFWANSTVEQKVMLVVLLCLRNKQDEDVVHAQDFVLAGHAGVNAKQVPGIIAGMIQLGAIVDESRQNPGKARDGSRQNDGLELELEKELEQEKKGAAAAPPPPPLAPPLEGDYSPKARALLANVTLDAQLSWLAAYPDPAWIRRELNKATAWIIANPKKAPKKFPAFMNNWLGRGWEQHRKTLPSNSAGAAEEPEWKRKVRAEEARKNAAG